MKAFFSLIAATALAAGSISLVGCESNNQANTPAGDQDSGYAGGNGAFGESPRTPGSYNDVDRPARGDVSNAPAKEPSNIPTTQPSAPAENPAQ